MLASIPPVIRKPDSTPPAIARISPGMCEECGFVVRRWDDLEEDKLECTKCCGRLIAVGPFYPLHWCFGCLAWLAEPNSLTIELSMQGIQRVQKTAVDSGGQIVWPYVPVSWFAPETTNFEDSKNHNEVVQSIRCSKCNLDFYRSCFNPPLH